MPINELNEILDILKSLDNITKKQLDKAIKNADKEYKKIKEDNKREVLI